MSPKEKCLGAITAIGNRSAMQGAIGQEEEGEITWVTGAV